MRSVSLNYRRFFVATSLAVLALVIACSSGDDESALPTPTATPRAADRVPTAMAPIPPTPIIDGTVVRSPTDTPANATATAVGSTPTTPSFPGAPTASPAPGATTVPDNTPTATATPPVLASGQELVNLPFGLLQLRPGIGVAAEFSPGVSAASFRVNVGFSNPFHPEFSPWNYGLKFRDDGQTFQMFMFDHRGNLNQINGNGNVLDIVRTVPVANMLTSGGAQNQFTFLVIEEKAFVLLDQVLIGIFDVSEPDRVGDISLVTDVFNETTFVGANTEFSDLVINSAGLIAFNNSGELVRQELDKPAEGEHSLLSSATYTQVTFVSPLNAFSGDYSYGLLFRVEHLGIDNWLVIEDSKSWRHIRRSTTGAEVLLGSGTADLLRTGEGDENFIEFVSTGEQHKVYLNGEFLTDVTFPQSDFPFTVAPMAAFDPGHQATVGATEYHDFSVWSVAE